MPELPEVETVRAGLAEVLEGRTLIRVAVRRPDMRLPFPDDLAGRLTGRRIDRIGRRAKYLLFFLNDGWTLIGHLGMSGSMRIADSWPAPPDKHDHVILATDAGAVVTFNDPRRFGFLTLTPTAELTAHPMLAALGPEPLDDAFTATVLAAALAGRRGSIKTALLDQRVVAGIGNIYASEALFHAGLSPTRSAQTVTGKRAERLVAAIKTVLREAVAAGGSTLRDHVRPDGELGYFQFSFAVYGRAGRPCPGCDCDLAKTGGIARIVQSGRATFYCQSRQR